MGMQRAASPYLLNIYHKKKRTSFDIRPMGWVSNLHRAATTDLPLLRSGPGGFIRSWPYRTYPYFKHSFAMQRYAFFPIPQVFEQIYFAF